MFDSGKLKGGAVVLILIAALAFFDSYGGHSFSRITGAVTLIDDSGTSTASALLGTSSNAEPTQSVTVVSGWNLISANSLARFESTTCSKDKFADEVYTYDPATTTPENPYNIFQYILGSDGKLLQAPSTAVMRPYQGMWFKNNGDQCTITYKDTPSTTFTVPTGWNLLAVNPSWVGKSLNDLTDSCNFGGVFFFHTYGPTPSVGSDHVFRLSEANQGIWVLVNSGQCSFKAITSTSNPSLGSESIPAVPQNQQKISYKVGEHPIDIAYDGTNIWVALESKQNLIRINTITGEVKPGTDYLGAGKPEDLLFDGASLWVAMRDPSNVVRVDVDSNGNGNVVCSAEITNPYILGYDGGNIWVGVEAGYSSYRIAKLSKDCQIKKKWQADGTPRYGSFDGQNMLVSNYFNVRKYDLEGNVKSFAKPSTDLNSLGNTVVGDALWVVSNDLYSGRKWDSWNGRKEGGLTEFSIDTGKVLSKRSLADGPQSINFDGNSLWMTLKTGNQVVKLDSSTGNELATYDVGIFPVSAVSDGSNLWVVNYDSGDVTELVGVTAGKFR